VLSEEAPGLCVSAVGVNQLAEVVTSAWGGRVLWGRSA
jgi:hypothetical protein